MASLSNLFIEELRKQYADTKKTTRLTANVNRDRVLKARALYPDYSTRELAALLSLSVTTTYTVLRTAGQIPPHQNTVLGLVEKNGGPQPLNF